MTTSKVETSKKVSGKAETPRKRAKREETPYVPPKRLSKMGEWRRNNPNGILKILDMRAVMK
jgi:hypothetical protein